MKIEDEIEHQVQIIRGHGINDSLVLVPYTNKRCFAPCGYGKCNCNPTISKQFCLVIESYKNRALQEANETLQFLNEKFLEKHNVKND